MILTDYYRFEKVSSNKTRIDCKASTQSYNPLEGLTSKKGELFLYIGQNTYTKAGSKRKADLALSKGEHISSIYIPDLARSLWYGDFKSTQDALLFVGKDISFVDGALQPGAVIEIFIARGQSHNKATLFNLLADDELADEMEALRQQANKLEKPGL